MGEHVRGVYGGGFDLIIVFFGPGESASLRGAWREMFSDSIAGSVEDGTLFYPSEGDFGRQSRLLIEVF